MSLIGSFWVIIILNSHARASEKASDDEKNPIQQQGHHYPFSSSTLIEKCLKLTEKSFISLTHFSSTFFCE
jgi:hypothetical protein